LCAVKLPGTAGDQLPNTSTMSPVRIGRLVPTAPALPKLR
jgi:hypothetical protein